MTPWERYQKYLERDDFTADPAQRVAVEHTQRLYDELIAAENRNGGLIAMLKPLFTNNGSEPVKGLYLWGGVGRGKTWIVDAFFDTLPFANKQRVHFHRFMQWVHNELKHLKNTESPLAVVAERFANDTRVLCFDEFHVTDITDAMLLAGLLSALFERGIILVATSNEAPDDLYADGLQRERFLPAIELIKQHTEVVHVDSGVDYRLRFLDKAEIYHSPLNDSAHDMLMNCFCHIAPDEGKKEVVLDIEGRSINTVRCADGVVWFDFNAICDGPRGAADYIEIAREFQTVLIGSIPVLDESCNDQARRFMTLVDEFYDRNVKLILAADADPENLYAGKRHARSFQRTISRLQEMRTHDYLAKQHLS